mmetsp:Transcript_15097/g.48340  ORF Transcript_15097/g.48340 Transcript_15097/m.48340 type:complete len:338 (-) Transcript_15097:36-1049(-)
MPTSASSTSHAPGFLKSWLVLALHEAHDHRHDFLHVGSHAGGDLHRIRHGLHDAAHEACVRAIGSRGAGGGGGQVQEHAARRIRHLVAQLALQSLEERVRLGLHIAVVGREAAAEIDLELTIPVLERRHSIEVEVELVLGAGEHLLVKLPHVRQARREALCELPRQHRLVSLLLRRLANGRGDLVREAQHAAIAVHFEHSHCGLLLRRAQGERAHLLVCLRLLLPNRIPNLAQAGDDARVHALLVGVTTEGHDVVGHVASQLVALKQCTHGHRLRCGPAHGTRGMASQENCCGDSGCTSEEHGRGEALRLSALTHLRFLVRRGREVHRRRHCKERET